MPTTIVQMFDQPFAKIAKQIPRLAKLGVTHLLVSPPQLSNPSRRWWGRYQPVDYRVIAGPLGDAAGLSRLCHLAAGRGLRVVVDAVLNHTTNHPHWMSMRGGRVVASRLPRFDAHDFRSPPPRAGRHHLPELRTESQWVRQELRDYLHGLVHLGVRGFRFDAAKHIDPGFFPFVLHGLPPLLLFGELVYARSPDFPDAYLRHMQAYDFPLARTMREAFGPGGDLRRLIDPHATGDALWGPQAIRFSNHHDLARRPGAFRAFRLDDARDRALAQVFVLAGVDGTPLVYAPDLRGKEAKAGIGFRRRVGHAPLRYVHATAHTLVFARGDAALVVLHKAGYPWAADALPCGVRPGRYRDLLGGDHWVDQAGRWRTAGVGPRQAALLVHQDLE